MGETKGRMSKENPGKDKKWGHQPTWFSPLSLRSKERKRNRSCLCVHTKSGSNSPHSSFSFLPSSSSAFRWLLRKRGERKTQRGVDIAKKSSINNRNYKSFQLFLRLKKWPKKSWQIPFHSKKKESAAIRRHLPFSPFASHKRSFFLRTVEERERERSVSDKKLPPTLSPSELSV